MRLPRMTTRRWMVVVAVVAVTFGAMAIERRRRADYTDHFLYHAQGLEGSSHSHDPSSFFARLPEAQQARQVRAWAYHRTMRDKYRRALSIPFWFVTEDPPPP